MRTRLQAVLAEDFGGVVADFARAIGAPKQRFSAWIGQHGPNRQEQSRPSAAYLDRICAATGRSAHWLVTGEGPEYARDSIPTTDLATALQARLWARAERAGISAGFLDWQFDGPADVLSWVEQTLIDTTQARSLELRSAALEAVFFALFAATGSGLDGQPRADLERRLVPMMRAMRKGDSRGLLAVRAVAEAFTSGHSGMNLKFKHVAMLDDWAFLAVRNNGGRILKVLSELLDTWEAACATLDTEQRGAGQRRAR
jgi:hypothetical protein